MNVKFQNIKKVVNSEPEEAKKLIKELLYINSHDTILSDAYKLYGLYYNVKGNIDSSAYYYTKSLSYSEQYPHRHIQGLINLSEAFRKKNELIKAEQLLLQAEKISLKNNGILLGRLYGMKGSIYNLMLRQEDALKNLIKAVEILKKDNDTVLLVTIQSSLAGNYMYKKNFAFAIDLYEEALKGFKRNNHMHNYYLTLINYADCHMYVQKPKVAIKALREAVAGFKHLNNEQMLVHALWKLAKAQSQQKNYTVALATYEKAQNLAVKNKSERLVNITAEYLQLLLQQNKLKDIASVIDKVEKNPDKHKANIEDKIYYEQQKAVFFEKTAQNIDAVQALKTALNLRDSLDNTRDNKEIIELQARYQNQLQREKNAALIKDNKHLQENNLFKKKIFWLSAIVIILSLIGAIFLIAFLRSKNRLQQETLKRIETDRRVITQEHENEMRRNELLQKNLELNKAALRNSEIQICHFINEIEQKNSLIVKYHEELILLKNNNAAHEVINNHKEKLNDLLSKAIVTEEKWDSFLKLFHDVYPDYLQQISQKLPGLTPAETRYLTLRKFDLSAREIAAVLGVQPDAIRLYRHRLRRKFGFSSDTQLDAAIK